MTDLPAWEPPPLPNPPVPTKSELKALSELDRTGRVGRTTVQVGAPAALIVIVTWVLRLANIDLDPGAGADMPSEVVAAFVTLTTVGLAFAMNRTSGDSGKADPTSVVIVAMFGVFLLIAVLVLTGDLPRR